MSPNQTSVMVREDSDGWWAPRANGVPGAAREVVDLVARMSSMPTVYVGRFIGDAVIPIAVSQNARGVSEGQPVTWHDTVCRRMVSRLGPHVVEDIRDVPNYSRSPFAIEHGLECYAGVPLKSGTSGLVGVLAAWDTAPWPNSSEHLEATLWTSGRLLAEVMATALERDDLARRAERDAHAQRPIVVSGRREWGQQLALEDRRTKNNAMPSALVLVDFGSVRSSQRLRRATELIASTASEAFAARLGPRHVGLLLTGDAAFDVGSLAVELDRALDADGFKPTVTWALGSETPSFSEGWQLARERLGAALRAGASS